MTASTPADPSAEHPVAEAALASRTLWYRYWLFGWIFEDCNRGNLFENAAALARNRRKAALLPVYLRRYATTGTLSLSLATLIGDTAPISLQLIAISPLLVCVPLLVICASIWVALLTPPV